MADACTQVFFPFVEVMQPAFRTSEGLLVCYACAEMCRQQARPQPVRSREFVCACLDGTDACLFGERLAEMAGTDQADRVMISLRNAAQQQQLQLDEHGRGRFVGTIEADLRKVAGYENEEAQAMAFSLIPVDELERRALEAVKTTGRHLDIERLHQLLTWFKNEFFSWCQNPKCAQCSSVSTVCVGADQPTAEERSFLAGTTEVYKCNTCAAHTRYPRFNDPVKLLETRTGRCGEFANCFTLCCRALGYDVRHVVDWTDHVWTEVYSPSLGRWLHCDPCEAQLENPLLYEAGWGKKLTYVIGIGVDGVVDVTRRYTRKLPDVLSRRESVSEDWLAAHLVAVNSRIFASMDSAKRETVVARAAREQLQLESCARAEADIDAELAVRMRGRITGSEQWRAERGEDGKGDGTAAAATRNTGVVADSPVRLTIVSVDDADTLIRVAYSAPGRGDWRLSSLDWIGLHRTDTANASDHPAIQRVELPHGDDDGVVDIKLPQPIQDGTYVVRYHISGAQTFAQQSEDITLPTSGRAAAAAAAAVAGDSQNTPSHSQAASTTATESQVAAAAPAEAAKAAEAPVLVSSTVSSETSAVPAQGDESPKESGKDALAPVVDQSTPSQADAGHSPHEGPTD